MATYSIESMVRGYHVYKAIWEAVDGEVLQCKREVNNRHDPFAVAVIKDNTIVGHVARKLSAICSLFLRARGSIGCIVRGSKRYSYDLPQGGLEIPCTLIFSGEQSKIVKIKGLIKDIMLAEESKKRDESVESRSEDKVDDLNCESVVKRRKTSNDMEWVCIAGNISLKLEEKEMLLGGLQLTDMHINASQMILKNQFPLINGLTSTLTVSSTSFGSWVSNYIQIFHCRGNHWITITTLGCDPGCVCVFDSLYNDIDHETKSIVNFVFARSDIVFIQPQVNKQQGVTDCGLFAIAYATYLAFEKEIQRLSVHQFEQKQLRTHLVSCLEHKYLVAFPLVIS